MEISLSNETVDVIMSNCVINLSEDKEKAPEAAVGGNIALIEDGDIIQI